MIVSSSQGRGVDLGFVLVIALVGRLVAVLCSRCDNLAFSLRLSQNVLVTPTVIPKGTFSARTRP